jgi:hypothetical protein
MTFEVYGLIVLGAITGFHFAYSSAVAHRTASEYAKLTQTIRHPGVTGVATIKRGRS